MSQYVRKTPVSIRYPYEYPLRLLGGGKWEGRIFIEIAFYRSLRYSELKSALFPVSDTILTSLLKRLMKDGFIEKLYVEQGNSLKVYYSLALKAQRLIPVMQQMCQWNREFGPHLSEEVPEECRQCPIHLGESLPTPTGCERKRPYTESSGMVYRHLASTHSIIPVQEVESMD